MLDLKTLCLSSLLIVLFVSCLAAQRISSPTALPTPTVAAKSFKSVEGGFSINIAEAPSETLNLGSEIAEKKGIDAGKMFIWKSEKTIYSVMYSDPVDADGNSMGTQTLEEMNSGARTAIMRQDGKLISEKSISLGKHPGTELHYTSSAGTKFITRHYLVNLRGYQIIAGYIDDKDKKEVLGVLDSFKLLTDKK